MQIGLLVCDQVNEEWRNVHGDYPEMYQSWLSNYELVLYKVYAGDFPTDPNDHTAWIATGSRYSAYDKMDWINWLKEFILSIRNTNSTFIGVCFGHQVLGEALGGTVSKSSDGWQVGVSTFEMLHHESWMTPFQPNINVLMMCQDQVIELPPNSKVLSSHPNCPNGMFVTGNQFLGIQGHPEFSKAYTKALMLKREVRIGIDRVKYALESLEMVPDNKLLADWISQFIRHRSL